MKKLLYSGFAALMMLLAFMGVGKAQTLTFNPPSGSTLNVGDEFSVTCSDANYGIDNIWFITYATLAEAQAKARNDFDDWTGDLNKFDGNYNHITAEKPVVAAVVTDDKGYALLSTITYAEYTIAGGETPDPEPATPIDIYKFLPASGTEVNPNQTITISSNGEGTVYYKVYATKADAEADNASWDAPTNSALTAYSAAKKPVIKENQLVVKANTWLTDNNKWDVFSYAEYTLKEITPAPDFTLAFNPDGSSNVEDGQTVTITSNLEITSDFSLYFFLYQTRDEAEVAWTNGVNAPLFAGLTGYSNQQQPHISATAGTVLKAGIFDKRTNQWVASSIKIQEYTIGQREPFVISFDPEAGEVDANTAITISTTPALTDGFALYYKLYETESAANADTWMSGNGALDYEDAIAYTETKKPSITEAKPVLKAAVWNAATMLWESNTVVAYTLSAETVAMPTFSVAAGQVTEGTKVTLSCATLGATIHYTVDGSVPSTESTEYTAAITIDKPMTIKAIAVKEGMKNSQIAEASYTVRPASGKATVRLVVNGDDCTLLDRNQYQLLLDLSHEMADTYAEELNESFIASDILPRLYGTANATIPAGLSAGNLAAGVDLDEEASIEVEPGLYDIFLLQSYHATWLGEDGMDIIRNVQTKGGFDPFYVDNVTLQAGLTYTFLVTFDRYGAHGELIMPVNLRLTEILGESKPSCELESTLVRLSIANIGSTDVEQYEVYYAVGNDTVRETVNATLAAGKDTVFTFGKRLDLKTGEKTRINAAVLTQGETAIEDNFGHYTALRTAPAALPVQINTLEMHPVKEADWSLDMNNALTAAPTASSPVFSSCFHVEAAGNYRLEYEYICGRYVELPDGDVMVNNIDKYKIRIGKSSEDWQEWPVVVNDSTITGSSNYDEFSPKEVFFEIEEPGDYAFCIYAERVNDENNLKFRNMQIAEVGDFEAGFKEFSVRAPRIVPQDWGTAAYTMNLNIANRGLKQLDSSDLIILANGNEIARQAIKLDINEKQALTLEAPVSGFKAGQTIAFSGKIVRKQEVLAETGSLKAEVIVSENTAAFDYLTDFSSVDGLQSYTGSRIGLIFPVVKTDTLTAIAIGWGEMEENTDISIAIQRIRMEDGQPILGDLIHQSTVRRGLVGGMNTYEIPAYLLTPGDYFVSVEQLGKVAFALAMDKHPEGGFYSYDITREKWTYYTEAGYPAIRTVFGANGKLITDDALVTAISKPIAGGIFADNEPIVVSVRNNGIDTAEIPVYVRVDNTVLEPQTVKLPSYATVNVTFNADLAAKDADRHIAITAFTALAGDKDLINDTMTKEVISFVPADPYRMDFESCLDFATEGFNPAWTSLSFDESPVLPLRHVLDAEFHYVEFPGCETDLGFIAFNPYATEPSMLFYDFYNSCRPHSGQRFGASLAITDPEMSKDDWLISPKLKMPASNTQLSMWVRSFDRALKESYEIWVSQGSGNPLDLDFIRVYPEDDYETLQAASEKWENVVFDLSEFNNKDIHVAIRCMSPDATMFMIDDIVIGENAANEQAQSADFRITVLPNPVHEMMTVLSPDASIKEVAIFNLSGLLIHQSASNLGTDNYRFNASGLLSGMYFARITTDKGTTVRKFIVR